MTGHGDVALACEFEESVDFKRDLASLVIVRDVEYSPRKWSWEVENVREVELAELPPELSPQTARWLGHVMTHL